MTADITARLGEIRARLTSPLLGKSAWREADADHLAIRALLAAVEGVLAVHQPLAALDVRVNRMRQVCTGCGTDGGNWQPYPCPTVRTITEALGGAS